MRRHHSATAIAFVLLLGLLSVAVQSIANAQEEDRSDWPSSIQTGFAINDLAATAWAVTSDADLTQRPIAATFWAADETPHPKMEKFSRANPRWRVQTVQAEFLVKQIAGLEAGSTSEVGVYLTSGAQDRLDLTAWARLVLLRKSRSSPPVGPATTPPQRCVPCCPTLSPARQSSACFCSSTPLAASVTGLKQSPASSAATSAVADEHCSRPLRNRVLDLRGLPVSHIRQRGRRA